jgi:hypothetical protein
MFWGETVVDQFPSTIAQTLASATRNITAILGMNEPDQGGQSNIPPQTGVQLWTTFMEPLRAKGLRLGSPALSSAPAGKTWLQDFFAACNGTCNVDFIALREFLIDSYPNDLLKGCDRLVRDRRAGIHRIFGGLSQYLPETSLGD